jgi:glucose-1-phosphate cytidylyltransferase
MKVVILAGGFGTRLSEETGVKPKPMVEIGDKPMIWHIMKIYSAAGIDDFIICLGYKGHVIKEYFAKYSLHMSDVTFDLGRNDMRIHRNGTEPWRVTLVDTGEKTMTGGRIKRIKDYIGENTFCLTYGDGVTDLDIQKLIAYHRDQKPLVTLTAVQPPGRFGAFSLTKDQNLIHTFKEKPIGDGAWVNGGFFVLEPQAIDYIDGDSIVWEQEPMENLARDGKLAAYRHFGYWQNMDSLRDKMVLEELWQSGKPPWKIW